MKFFELKQFVQEYKQLISNVSTEVSREHLITIDSEDNFSRAFDGFINQKTGAFDDEHVDMSEFFQYLQMQDDCHLMKISEPGLVEAFCKCWLKETDHLVVTFMGTDIGDISLDQIIFIDGRYASAEEILLSLEENAKSGKNIYINPHCHPQALFTESAQNVLKRHPTTTGFIRQYGEKQVQAAKTEFPDRFYDDLEHYLMALHDIGNQSSPWSFPENKVSQCEHANTEFIEKIRRQCSAEAWEILQQKIITVPFRDSRETASAKFGMIVHGIAPYDCIITQQIYLWSMLRGNNPHVGVLKNVINSPQAMMFDLGSPRTVVYSDKNLEKSFSGLRGAFLSAPKKSVKDQNKKIIQVQSSESNYFSKDLEESFPGMKRGFFNAQNKTILARGQDSNAPEDGQQIKRVC